jgi:uncharacterized membrane protein (DUF485 family)
MNDKDYKNILTSIKQRDFKVSQKTFDYKLLIIFIMYMIFLSMIIVIGNRDIN